MFLQKWTFKGLNLRVHNMYRSDVQTRFILQYITDLSWMKVHEFSSFVRHKQNKMSLNDFQSKSKQFRDSLLALHEIISS